MSPRTILHVDLDAFFAAVEQRDQPSLRGKPVLVGGSRARGVVAAASYEARCYGIRSAMAMAEALRRCPHAVVIAHRMERYADASERFFALLGDYSPLVESLSVDEAFIDVTGADRLLGDGGVIARAIKERVRRELGLVASVGVAPSKFVAKIASDIDKPDGLRIVAPEGVLAFLHPLPVSRLWGVGQVTQTRLLRLGLTTLGQVAAYPEALLRRQLGTALGTRLAGLARGHDPRSVEPAGAAFSIGHEVTFERDIVRRHDLEPTIYSHADRVAARLRRADLRARVVILKVKYADFHLVTRRTSVADATSDGGQLARVALELLAKLPVDDDHGKRHRVRLCGVAASGLESKDAPRQLLCFGERERRRNERLGDTLDQIRARFGDAVIGRALCQGEAPQRFPSLSSPSPLADSGTGAARCPAPAAR